MTKHIVAVAGLLLSSPLVFGQSCDEVKTENQRLRKENMFLKSDNVMLKGENLTLKYEGKSGNFSVKPGLGYIQTSKDIEFAVLSATGDKKTQLVTVIIKFTNKAANKEGFFTMIKTFSAPDGEEFTIKSSMLGKDAGYKTLSTDAPIQGTYVFEGVLPKVTTIKMIQVPFQLLEKNGYDRYQVDLRDILITWK